MPILDLPPELRLRIYDFIPDLRLWRYETVAPNTRLTPAISRVNRQLRHETLPIYAANAHFSVQANSHSKYEHDPVTAWLQALGPLGLRHVRSIQLSQHWNLTHPTRGVGHEGFYIRLEKTADGVWQCTSGTYPVAKDTREMRLESVELLEERIKHNVLQPMSLRDRRTLTASDLTYIISATGVVASHPIPAYDILQRKADRKRHHHSVWTEMERQLHALNASDASPDTEHRQIFMSY